MAKDKAAIMREIRAKRKAAGLVKVELFIRPEYKEKARQYEIKWQQPPAK